MSMDLFEHWADSEVPPVPEDFDRGVHQRVNRSLLVVQTVDLLCRAAPFALIRFLEAFIGFVGFTLSNKYPNDRGERSPRLP